MRGRGGQPVPWNDFKSDFLKVKLKTNKQKERKKKDFIPPDLKNNNNNDLAIFQLFCIFFPL